MDNEETNVQLPEPLEAWLDGHCEPGMDDDPDEADRDRRVIAQAFAALLGPEAEVNALSVFADRLFSPVGPPDGRL